MADLRREAEMRRTLSLKWSLNIADYSTDGALLHNRCA
jgi:hypothetical protein